MAAITLSLSMRRWMVSTLVCFVAVLAIVGLAATASAAATAGTAETRVGASSVVSEVPVGPPERIAAGQRLGNEPVRVVTTVATGVAAKSGYGPQTLSAAQLPRYEAAPYHGLTRTGRKNPAPTNGQETLAYSLQMKSTSTRRVGVDPDAGEYVVFDQTSAGIFHGHVRSWSELDNLMQRTLIGAGMVNRRGKIL